jgi:hypothetical protein
VGGVEGGGGGEAQTAGGGGKGDSERVPGGDVHGPMNPGARPREKDRAHAGGCSRDEEERAQWRVAADREAQPYHSGLCVCVCVCV